MNNISIIPHNGIHVFKNMLNDNNNTYVTYNNLSQWNNTNNNENDDMLLNGLILY